MGPVLLNPRGRIVKIENVLCGSVITGTDKIRSGFGNGDCVFVDFKRSIFAIADGTERYPWASRELLARFHGSLNKYGRPGSTGEWKQFLDDVYAEQKYHHKTTFTCVAVTAGEDYRDLVISHGGDSFVSIMDMSNREITFQTSSDMNFAGRSREILDITEHRIRNHDTRLIIATDGMNDIMKIISEDKHELSVVDTFMEQPVESVCASIRLVLEQDSDVSEYDDTSYIILDLFNLGSCDADTILMGGTRSQEEKRFRQWVTREDPETWVPAPEWNLCGNEFAQAGIVIVGEG